MSASTEFYHSDNYVTITIDIEDCPVVEFPLTELFDIASSTIVDNYLEVLQEYVTQILEDTTWLDKQSKLCLLRARFCVYQRKNDGTLYTLRQSALQRLITQTLRCDYGVHRPIEVPLFVRLRSPEINVPRKTRFPVALAPFHTIHTGAADAVFAPGLNESANNYAVDEESPAVDIIPYAVEKRTNDLEPYDITISQDFDAKSTVDNDFVEMNVSFAPIRSDFGLVSGSNNANRNRNDLCNGDVHVVVENDNDNIATATVTDVRGTSTSMGATVDCKTCIHSFHHTEDRDKMPPKGGTDHAPYQTALAAVLFLMHHEPSGVPLPSELMRYHPIDRGRCICPSFFHCQSSGPAS